MNAKTKYIRNIFQIILKNIYCLIIGVFFFIYSLSAKALDWGTSVADPLQAMPKAIDATIPLPGDQASVSCISNKDYKTSIMLIDAIDLALCNNQQIKGTWLGIKIQANGLGEALASYLPNLSYTTSRLRSSTGYPGIGITDVVNYGNTVNINLAWRLFDFGGRRANREVANKLLASAIASHEAALQKTMAAVIQSYFDAQIAKVTVETKEQNEELARNTLDSTKRRENRGVAAKSDTLQAATALAKSMLDKNRAQGEYRKAIATLAYLIGEPTFTEIKLADDLSDKTIGTLNTLQNWLEIAQKTHPAIIAAQAEWEASKSKVLAVRSEGLPTIDFSNNYYKNGFPNQGVSAVKSSQTTLGIALSIPVFEGFSRIYKIQGAQAQAEQREAQLQDTQRNIFMEIIKAHADALASLNNLLVSEQLLSAAQESQQTLQRKYEKGAADILEMLSAQAALSDARQERIRCLAEWRSARLRLLSNVGVMGRSALDF